MVRRIVRVLPDGPAPDVALRAFAGPGAADEQCLVLCSGLGADAWNRYSYFAAAPAWVLSSGTSGRGERCTESLAQLRVALGEIALDERDRAPAGQFVGGYAGYLAYELGSSLEGVPPAAVSDLGLPAMRWAFYDAVACYDHHRRQWELSALVLDSEHNAVRALDRLEQRIRSGVDKRFDVTATAPNAKRPDLTDRTWASSFSRNAYLAAVARAKEYIAAGDIYQANLSQRLTWSYPEDDAIPGELFRRLLANHPANYSALLAWRDGQGQTQALCSASPELFLSLHGRRVVTRPIKGTRRRGPTPQADAAAIAALLASEKDAAELAMIVDLERNDLGRVCRPGTIRVEQARAVESFAHVHHTVATVTGELDAGRDCIDLIEATFPGGSITGAPKIRAMQIIAELEPVARSAYCGAIGWLGVNGDAELNIAIRTAIVDAGRIHLHVGGGIVADSDPAAEYQETLDKARGLADAIAATCANSARVGRMSTIL